MAAIDAGEDIQGELIRLSQRGDPVAFARLMAPHLPRLKGICAREVRRGQRSADVEDALQETLLAAWVGIARFRGHSGRSFNSWLNTVCRHAVANMYRRPIPEPMSEPVETIESGERPTEELVEARLMHQARAMYEDLDQLPPAYREALALRVDRGWTFRQIAAHQMTSVSGAKSRVNRAKRALAIMWRDRDG